MHYQQTTGRDMKLTISIERTAMDSPTSIAAIVDTYLPGDIETISTVFTYEGALEAFEATCRQFKLEPKS